MMSVYKQCFVKWKLSSRQANNYIIRWPLWCRSSNPKQFTVTQDAAITPTWSIRKRELLFTTETEKAQYLGDLFWNWWVKEYLPNLQECQTWNKINLNLQPGDIVMILDENALRNSWLLGRVVQIKIDAKGLTQQVLVRTRSSILERPFDKLCLMRLRTRRLLPH